MRTRGQAVVLNIMFLLCGGTDHVILAVTNNSSPPGGPLLFIETSFHPNTQAPDSGSGPEISV